MKTFDKQLSNSLRDSMGVAAKGEIMSWLWLLLGMLCQRCSLVLSLMEMRLLHLSTTAWSSPHADLVGEPHWRARISHSAALQRKRWVISPKHHVGHWDLSAGSSLQDCELCLYYIKHKNSSWMGPLGIDTLEQLNNGSNKTSDTAVCFSCKLRWHHK